VSREDEFKPVAPPRDRDHQADRSDTLPCGSDTFEYQTRVTRKGISQPLPQRGRGYWVGASEQGVSPADRPSAAAGPRDVRRKPSKARRTMWLVLLLAAFVGVATAAGLMLTGRTVVPVLSEKIFPIHYQQEIAQAAEDYGQDAYLVAAVVKAESGYDPEAGSGAGAVGLMQLMPATADWVVTEVDAWKGDDHPVLTDATDSLELGTCYLAYLGEKYGDGTLLALAAYNAGPRNVEEWIEAAGGRESFGLDDIQFPETRAYVERVEHYRALYLRIHPDVFVK
jgi:soluble lytic murein transglycosylase